MLEFKVMRSLLNKLAHSMQISTVVCVQQVIGQHRLSDQSYESGVSSRQSYHSTSSSSLGSLDRLEESGHASTINVQQLIQAGVPVSASLLLVVFGRGDGTGCYIHVKSQMRGYRAAWLFKCSQYVQS